MAWAAIRSIAETLGKEPEHFIAFNKGPIPFLAADESAPVPPFALIVAAFLLGAAFGGFIASW